MGAHSTVKYVEPNINVGMFSPTSKDIENGYEIDDWHGNDGFDRAPRLEDYCIALNLEVEISSREIQGTKDVLILQWSGDNNKGVSFMGGTKIGGYEYDGLDRKARLTSAEYLTTYYADMYVGDLIDYGTTEMIGIKSVNIEYEKSCVPKISIKFTDVRGLSLFQPTELSRTNSYDGIKGLSKDNVAQSFFQCFFKMPLPKFTIYIKGFYGKPVAYVMMCDKFETNFNSETGDYDVDTHFIGYNYSFLTDISFDAFLAAPYSDFEGKRYWDEQTSGDNPRFFLWDKLHTKKMPMPTLYEIHRDFKKLLNTSASGMLDTTLTSEELTHEDEITKLGEIKQKYQQWYEQLFILLKEKYNKRYCFEFRNGNKEDSDWYRILILTNSKTSTVKNLSEAYKQYPETFKKTNNDLYATIEEFNNSKNGYRKLDNISKDFSKYTRIKLFNDCYVNSNTRKVEFGGFNRECEVNKTQVVNRLFYSENTDLGLNGVNQEEINKYKSSLKDFTLSTIYGDGTDQYKDAFIIEVDYSDITNRIKALTADSKKSVEQKEKAKKRKEHNDMMMSMMNWYPSVENFMKVVMAHVETYMMMMYKVRDDCATRTAKDLGISVGVNGDACDVNGTSNIVPPFPRVTKEEIGDDNITKTVDAWVGDYNGEKRFIEADLVNGFFNAVEYLQELEKQSNEAINGSETLENTLQPAIKHPLTSYDFFMTKKPYGDETDVTNNPNAFAAKVAMRMFSILSLSNFKKEYGDKWSFARPEFLEMLGSIEAENFHDCVKITNSTMLKMLGIEGGESVINPQDIIDCVKSGKTIGNIDNIPWKTRNDKLFDENFWLTYYQTSYSKSNVSNIYPMQNISFSALEETLSKFNKGIDSIDVENNDILASNVNAVTNYDRLLKSSNKSSFGNLFIVDDYKAIANVLDNSCSSLSTSYNTIYEMIHDKSVFNGEEYKNMLYANGVFRPKKDIVTPSTPLSGELKTSNEAMYINEKTKYTFDTDKLDSFVSESENKSITSWFFTECRGYTFKNNTFKLNVNSSLFAKNSNYSSIVEQAHWKYTNNPLEMQMGFFLMGLEAINYDTVAAQLGNFKTFSYIPKLAVLQIGAALASLDNILENITTAILSTRIPLPRTFDRIFPYLNSIAGSTRIAYIRYFKDWVEQYGAEVFSNLSSRDENKKNVAMNYTVSGKGLFRQLFKEDSSFILGLGDNLMMIVIVVKGNVNHYKKLDEPNLVFSDTTATLFLRGFLSRLKELYGVHEESTNNAVKLAAEPTLTTDDMKKELYRYLKLVYEKWIPSMEFEEWKYETFFDITAEERIRNNGSGGHMFHFIDSFYNKIGDKLLINPMGLSEIIDNALSENNTNVMLLGFIADVLNKNRTMLLCLQNFQDLSESEAMDMMFRPIPYNGIKDINKHPDFVVLYPYEPSKYLNVDNGEFNDDSFMLNDEFDTPMAIRSRGENENNHYKIPAFGVSYGKQYQSYFKKINVGMKNPIATQQAIMAKHAILRRMHEKKTQTAVGQDLYDVYSTQSYTCTVEMMGCAWVQPLMYFVLTNVPLFKGSYLIFKVTHSITPGNMTTTFQGTRMANVTNRLVDEIFTDDELDSADGITYTNDIKGALANVDNDCPYNVYPLFESDAEISKDELENAKNAMTMLMSSGFTKAAAAGICGNIYKESTWRLHATNGIGAFGLCQWTSSGNRKENLIKEYGQKPTFAEQMKYIVHEWNGGDGTAYKHKGELMATKSPSNAAEIVCKWFERPGKAEADLPTRKKKADQYFNAYEAPTYQNTKIKPNNEDIYIGFLNAVQKSLSSTNCNVIIEKESITSNGMRIKQKDGGTQKMDLVFDIILNGYYQYVQKLTWVASGKDFLSNPKYIDVVVSQSVKTNERNVMVSNDGKWYQMNIITFGNDGTVVNQSLLKSLYKRYKADPQYKKEIPQFTNFDIFKEMQIQDCNALMTNGNLQSPSQISPNDAGMIDGWDVGKACAHLISRSSSQSQHACAKYVEEAIAAGGGPLKNKMSCGSKGNYATNLRYNGILEKNGFIMIDKGTVAPHGDVNIKLQSGDVAIIGADAQTQGSKFHACMYCSQGWISDFKQKHMSPYSSSFPYAIYRYKNKQKA